MKILIISGFLGAGKTSFIQALARATGRQFVIVENEFSELDVDARLLEESPGDGEMKVWQLTEGCICCSLNLDFGHSILTISNTLDPDYLIVEPSGVAHPSRIVKQLSKLAYERIELLAPVTIIDGTHWAESQRDFPEYFHDQLRTAGQVVISKSESFSPEDFHHLEKSLRLRPDVIFTPSHYSTWSPEQWWALLARKLVVGKGTAGELFLHFVGMGPQQAEDALENIAFTSTKLQSPEELITFLELLSHGFGGRVVRAKGYLPLGEHTFRFDLVDGQYEITGLAPMPDTRIVVIGRSLEREKLQRILGL